jgi:hypothetical protein
MRRGRGVGRVERSLGRGDEVAHDALGGDHRRRQLGMEGRRDGGAVLPAGASHGACAVVGGRLCGRSRRPVMAPGFVGRPVGGVHGAVDGTNVAIPAALEGGREQQREHRHQGGAPERPASRHEPSTQHS